MDAERPSFYQPRNDVNDLFSNGLVIDAAREIPLRGTDVDDGIKFDPIRPLHLRIEIDSPEVFLAGSVLQEESFLVCVEFSVEGHDFPLNIHDGFDKIPKSAFGHDLEIRQGYRGVDDFHELYISQIVSDYKAAVGCSELKTLLGRGALRSVVKGTFGPAETYCRVWGPDPAV